MDHSKQLMDATFDALSEEIWPTCECGRRIYDYGKDHCAECLEAERQKMQWELDTEK